MVLLRRFKIFLGRRISGIYIEVRTIGPIIKSQYALTNLNTLTYFQADYETVRNFAESNNICVLANSKQRVVVVTKEGHEPVKKFWKRHSRQQH